LKLIQLTKSFSALVDDDLFHFLSKWNWHYNSGYAERRVNGKHIRMHQVVQPGSVDHVNGNTLDNRRLNLRPVTKSQNAMNMRKHRGASYKGVSKEKSGWRVQIWKDNKRVFSASAPTERQAAMIYDLNAQALFGKYARPNFPNSVIMDLTAGGLPE
jgi:HNH endonuclease